MLAHDIRGRCWWYGGREWIFLPRFHYILLLCDRWQQRGSMTEWHLTWKCLWSKGVSINSSMWKRLRPLTLIDACWILWKPNVDVSTVRWWVVLFSISNSDVKDKPGSGWSYTAVTPWNEEHLDQLDLRCELADYNQGTVHGILVSVCWKLWWQHWNITKFPLSSSHERS